MKKLTILIVFACAIFVSACSTTSYNEREIIGRWFSQSWLREGQETGLTAWFEFNEDKTYRAVIQRQKEEGKWWIDGYKLYTEAEGQQKIVVEIVRLEGSILEIGMNRGGQEEHIVFGKAN